MLLAGIQQEIVFFSPFFFLFKESTKASIFSDNGQTLLCPTQSHVSMSLCSVSIPMFFLDKEDSSHQSWVNPAKLAAGFGVKSVPSWFVWGCSFRGDGVVYSQDVLDDELVLLVPVPLLVCVPSIHKQTGGATPHFLLKCGNFCDFTEIPLH